MLKQYAEYSRLGSMWYCSRKTTLVLFIYYVHYLVPEMRNKFILGKLLYYCPSLL